MSIGPGFHRNVSKADYLSDPCDRPSLTNSIAKLMVQRSPAHAWSAHPKGANHRREPSEAMKNGTLLDSLLFGGDAELVESPYDDYRKNEAREWKALQELAGKLPVKAKELKYARLAADAIREGWAAQGLALSGEDQLVVVWDEESSSGPVRCRARLDHWIADDLLIVDGKTTENAHPSAVAKTMVNLGYCVQEAAYVSAIETLMPEAAGRVRMLFAFAETEPPYATLVAHGAGTMRTLGRHYWRRAVEEWGRCLKAGQWPGYAAGETEIEAPSYAMVAFEEETLAGGSSGITF